MLVLISWSKSKHLNYTFNSCGKQNERLEMIYSNYFETNRSTCFNNGLPKWQKKSHLTISIDKINDTNLDLFY